MLPGLVRIPRHHRQRFVTGNALHGRQVHTTLNQARYRGMPQRVAIDFQRIQSHRRDHPPKRFLDSHSVVAGAIFCREQPRRTVATPGFRSGW